MDAGTEAMTPTQDLFNRRNNMPRENEPQPEPEDEIEAKVAARIDRMNGLQLLRLLADDETDEEQA